MDRGLRTKAKVAAVNRAHRVAMEVWQTMHDIFAPLVGEKIDKADGTFLAKIAKLLPELPHDHSITVIRVTSDYTLAWSITCNESIGDASGTVYYGISTYIGNMSGGVLIDLNNHGKKPVYRTNYTVKELLQKRDDCKAKKNAYEVARSDCWPFDEEYDN